MARIVIGSCHLLRLYGRYLFIDCGLFQGSRRNKEANWQPFPVPPEHIEAILLTHAHIDHTGYLPRLVQQGFGSPIYATEATCALLDILLPDSAHLNEQDVAYANKKGHGKHHPSSPLQSPPRGGDKYPPTSRCRPNGFTVFFINNPHKLTQKERLK